MKLFIPLFRVFKLSVLIVMKRLVLLLLPLSISLTGYSQILVKRTDSIVNSIDAKKTLTVASVSDTFPVSYSKLLSIENVKFYSAKGTLLKVIFTTYYLGKDSTKTNILTEYDVFYFNKDLLIKVISKDFDQSPPKDMQFYLNERHLKKYVSKETINSSKYEGANYFIELGYNLLEEFKLLTRK